MSILKELQESHDAIKAISLSAFLIPFWYVAIYLFGNNLFLLSGNIVVLAFCIILSVVSASLSSWFCAQTILLDEKVSNLTNNMIVSVVILSLWLALLIFITYSLEFLFKKISYLYWFIIIYFAPILILNFLALVSKNRTAKIKN